MVFKRVGEDKNIVHVDHNFASKDKVLQESVHCGFVKAQPSVELKDVKTWYLPSIVAMLRSSEYRFSASNQSMMKMTRYIGLGQDEDYRSLHRSLNT